MISRAWGSRTFRCTHQHLAVAFGAQAELLRAGRGSNPTHDPDVALGQPELLEHLGSQLEGYWQSCN